MFHEFMMLSMGCHVGTNAYYLGIQHHSLSHG